MKGLETIKPSKVKVFIRQVANRLDRAISMGVAAAYPILFTMDAPDPLPDWKDGVRFGWRVVKVTAHETIKILRKGMFLSGAINNPTQSDDPKKGEGFNFHNSGRFVLFNVFENGDSVGRASLSLDWSEDDVMIELQSRGYPTGGRVKFIGWPSSKGFEIEIKKDEVLRFTFVAV